MAGLAAGRLFRASIVAVGALLLLALACPVRAGVLDTTWNAPTTHPDGRPLTTLKYYRVYYGTSNPPCPTSPSLVVPSITLAPAPGTVVSATLTGLITGTLYFIQVTAVDEDGDESACSSPASGVTRPAQLAVTITSVDIDPTTTGVKTLIVAGAVSGNEGVPQVSWTNSQGDSGTASGTTNWTVSGLVLQPGANVLTITATDEARNAGRAILTVDYVPLDVTITSATVNPTTTGTKTLTLAGTVSGHEGVPQVTWANSHGDGGTATGTTNWTASGIILQPGANVLTITARDAAGNAGATIFTVNYAPPPTITSINPTSVIAGGSAFTLVVAGTNFVDVFSQVQVNGVPRTTSYVSPTQLTATVLASDIAEPGTAQVTVLTSGGNSNTASLTISPQSSTSTGSSMTAVPVTDAATVPGGSTGNSAASDSMFNADGTLFYLHHRDVGTFLYSADRGTGHVTPLGQLPANTPNGDPLAYDGAPWDPTNPNVLYAIVMSTTRRELWQLTLPLPAVMTLLHDFSNEVPTGGYPSSRVQVSADGRYFVIVASTMGGSGTYDHVTVWDRQTGESQAWPLPSGIGGLLLRSMVFDSRGAYALLETIDSSGRTDVVLLTTTTAASTATMTAVPVTDAATVPGGSTGNSAASDSMFNADGTLFYLHHRDVGTFLYSVDRGTGHVTPLGQLPASTPNGDPLAYDGAPWDPINPDVLYAIVMSTTRRELWQLTLPLPAEMTLLHDFSNEVPTGGYPSSRVQVSADGRDVVIVASTTGGSGTYDHVMVWDRQTGGSQTWQLPSGIGGLLLRSMVFDSRGAYALLETIDSSGRTDVVYLMVPSAP